MKCPACGAAELVRDTRDMPHTYKGETTTIAAVVGDYCPACGEGVLDAAESASGEGHAGRVVLSEAMAASAAAGH